MTFALVRAEPSPKMLEAAVKEREGSAIYKVLPKNATDVMENNAAADHDAMLAASEPPTDAEIDGLCRAMWPDAAQWSAMYDGARAFPVTVTAFETAQRRRDKDRTRMRAFLQALTGQQP